MPSVRRSAEVRWTAEQMYALVNDIESYPAFLNWCSGARILEQRRDELIAELEIGFAGISQRFATINTLRPPEQIELRLRSGPFRSLNGVWTFTPLDVGCRIDLAVDFSVSFSPLSFVLGGAFEQIARSQMDAFVARAQETYG